MGRDQNFGDVASTYIRNVTKMDVFLRSKKHQFWRGSKFHLNIVLSPLIGLAYAEIFEKHLGKVF